jgi:hypothetical protein
MIEAKLSNQSKAPQCAAFVEKLRAVFGEVKVLYVEENGFILGEPCEPRDHLPA